MCLESMKKFLSNVIQVVITDSGFKLFIRRILFILIIIAFIMILSFPFAAQTEGNKSHAYQSAVILYHRSFILKRALQWQ
jgi:hypothetical protein